MQGGGFDASLVWQVVLGLVMAGAIYGGIRSDLQSIHEHILRLERAAERAHRRLDDLSRGRRDYDVVEL